MPVRMTKKGRAETREDKRSEQANQQAMSAQAASSPSEGKGSTKAKEPKSPTERKNENKAQIREARMTSTAKRYGERYTPGMLTGGQAKLAAKAPPPNKLDEKDFAVLRAEKAKGRGMGLQDESKKPGKIYKAALGIMAMKKASDKGAKGPELLSPVMLAKRLFKKKTGGVMKYKRGSGLDLPVISSVKPAVHTTKKAVKTAVMKEQFNKQKSRMGKNPNSNTTTMAEMRKAKGFKPGESASQFNKRKTALSVAKKAASATKIGKIALGVGAAGVAAQQYLKSKMNKKKDVKKKMGGGMIEKLMANKKSFANSVSPVTMPQDRKNQTTGPVIMPYDKMGGGVMKNQTTGPMLRPYDKMGGGVMKKPMGYKGGGMDTGRVGEMKSRIAVAVDRIKKAKKSMGIGSGPIGGGRLTDSDKEKIKSLIGKNKAARPIKRNMGGMMMQRPMGYKHGTSVTAKCKLGRNKPTKIT